MKSSATEKNRALVRAVVMLYVQTPLQASPWNKIDDPDVPRDMLHACRTLIPQHGMGFQHGEENSDAHIKPASSVRRSLCLSRRASCAGPLAGNLSLEFDGGPAN